MPAEAISTETMTADTSKSGDLLIISGHRVGEPQQIGEILEVLGTHRHRHYRVRWDDGHESIFFPGSDAIIRPKAKRPSPA
jgi:hypothetical protein